MVQLFRRIDERLHIRRLLYSDAVNLRAACRHRLSAAVGNQSFGDVDEAIAESCDRLVLGHVVARGVLVDVLDIPTLFSHPRVAFDDTDNRSCRGGVAVGIPAEVERRPKGLNEVAPAVEQGGDGAGGVQFVAVVVAHAAVDGVFLLDAGQVAPVGRVFLVPEADVMDERRNTLLRIEGFRPASMIFSTSFVMKAVAIMVVNIWVVWAGSPSMPTWM